MKAPSKANIGFATQWKVVVASIETFSANHQPAGMNELGTRKLPSDAAFAEAGAVKVGKMSGQNASTGPVITLKT